MLHFFLENNCVCVCVCVYMFVSKWIEAGGSRAQAAFELSTHPKAKRLTEDWSGSSSNKDTFISTALSTHFRHTLTHTLTHTYAGGTRVWAIRFHVLRCLNALLADTFPICQRSIWGCMGGAYHPWAVTLLIRLGKRRSGCCHGDLLNL